MGISILHSLGVSNVPSLTLFEKKKINHTRKTKKGKQEKLKIK